MFAGSLIKAKMYYYKRRGLKIGKNCHIGPNVFIDPSHRHLISIGNETTLSPNVMIFAHDASTKRYIGYTKIGKVSIGNKCFIGAGTIILPGVKIGDNVIIGAGSLVTKDINSNCVAVGRPADYLCSLEEFKAKHCNNQKNNIEYVE